MFVGIEIVLMVNNTEIFHTKNKNSKSLNTFWNICLRSKKCHMESLELKYFNLLLLSSTWY